MTSRSNKVAVITDTHIGVRNDSSFFLDNQEHFFKEVFFPHIEKEGIDTIIHAGDVFDKRKNISPYTLWRAKSFFIDEIIKRNLTIHIVVGNHDVFYKTTNNVNTPELLLKNLYGCDNFKVYTKSTDIKINDRSILLIPWITKDNAEESMSVISKTKSDIAIGHLDIAGFQMYRGILSSHGMDKTVFDHIPMVLSGHFHHKSSSGNIHYLGATTEHTWMDHDDPRGYHFLDLSNGSLEFHRYENYMFKKFKYNDEEIDYSSLISNEDYWKNFTGCYVKLVIDKKTDPIMLNSVISCLNDSGSIDVSIVEDKIDVFSVISVENDEDTDTVSLIREYANVVKEDKKREMLTNLLIDLYQESQKNTYENV